MAEAVNPRELYEMAQKAYRDGDYSSAQSSLEQALTLFLKREDFSGASAAGMMLGHIARIEGNLTVALSQYTQTLEIVRRIVDKHAEATVLTNLGGVYADMKQMEEAIKVSDQALSIYREIGDGDGEANALSNLAVVYYNLQQTDKSIELSEQALRLYEKIGNKGGKANVLNNLGNSYFDLGETHKAINYWEQALPIHREIGNKIGEAIILSQLGSAYAQLGNMEEARRLTEEALKLEKKVGDSASITKLEQTLEQMQKKTISEEEQKLYDKARDWESNRHSDDKLLNSSELEEAEKLLKERDLTESMRAFLQASRRAIQQAAQEEQVQTSSVSSTASESAQVFSTPTISEEISLALSPTSRRAIGIAENLRRQIENPDSRYLFTEYLLIGLNELPEEAASALLVAFGLDRLRLVRGLSEIRKWQIPSELSYEEADISERELASLPYSANTPKVLEVALRIHKEKQASAIQPRHLLAALLEVENAVAYSWMVDMGIPTTLVRETLKRIPEKQKITPAMFAFAPGVASADLTAEKDSLGFDPYAQALAEIIIKKETVPPVVFGIYGPWGSGKSTFMSFVKKHLENWDIEQQRRRNKSPFLVFRLFQRRADRDEMNQSSQDVPRILCVSFDAWAYTDANKLWVGLIQAISQKLDEQITWWKRPIYWLRRTGWQFAGAVLLSLLPLVVGIAIALAQPLWDSARNLEFVRYVIGLFGFLGSLKLVDNQKPLSDIVQTELNKLDRTEIEGVINRIQKQIHATVEKYFKLSEEKPVNQESAQGEVRRQKKLKLVVFIDELDRCPLEKIVDILESIKLFLAEDIFIVLMAVDTRVAAEAIRLHYKEVENPELAHEYLEKIIQVPIPVPMAKKENLKTYLDSMMSVPRKEQDTSKDVISVPHSAPMPSPGSELILTRSPLPVTPEPFKPFNLEDTSEEQQAIIDFVEKHLAGNPRRIKRLLNTYRYVKILATRQGLRTDRGDWQKSMILWLGSTMSWPGFMEEAINQAKNRTTIESTFWEKVAKEIPEDICPPGDSFILFPSNVEDLKSLASLANNFIKENPPRPKRKERE
jgi:tetratricopeptide (TPR) repeat protein